MKREDILNKLGYTIPLERRKRVILHTDLKNEADDQYAVMHHLLTPSEEVVGIIAAHFEWLAAMAEKKKGLDEQVSSPEDFRFWIERRRKTMELSYAEGEKILRLAKIDDVPLLRGSIVELTDKEHLPESEGADFIVREAMKDDPRPLYVCALGGVTDIAIAYLKEPRIAEKLTVIWIGGGPYPNGEVEYNVCQDILAANILFESDISLWQIPSSVYRTMKVSFSILEDKVKPCGEIGKYLYDQLIAFCKNVRNTDGTQAEAWSLGDSPTVSVLMDENFDRWREEYAPFVNPDASYSQRSMAKKIRVYKSVDVRFTLEDMFAKLKKCYGGQNNE